MFGRKYPSRFEARRKAWEHSSRGRWWLEVISAWLLLIGIASAVEPYLVVDPRVYVSSDPMPAPRLFTAGRTPNQRHVASELNQLVDRTRLAGQSATMTPGLQPIIPMNSPMAPPVQRAMLSSLGGEVYGSMQTLSLQIAGLALRTASNRIVNTDLFLHEGDSLFLADSNSDSINSGSSVIRGQHSISFVSTWMQGYGGSGGFSYDGNASASDYDLGGMAYGIDLGRDETGVIGIMGGNTSTSFDDNLSDSVSVNSFQIGLYGLKRNEVSYFFGVMNYGHNRFEVNRIAGLGLAPSAASSCFAGNQFGTYYELGLNLETSSFRLQPFVGMQHVLMSNSQAHESGPAGLNVAAENFHSLQSQLGARLIAHRLTDAHGRRWSPYLNGRWAMELMDNQASVFASLNGAPSTGWVVSGNQPARNVGMISPGLSVELSRGMSLFVAYEYQWGANFRAQTGTGGFLFTF